MATKDKKPTAQPKERKPREKVPENESKADKFKRLASKRVNKALKAIGGIAALGGSGYESTPEQRERIATALANAVESATDSLNRVKADTEAFTL